MDLGWIPAAKSNAEFIDSWCQHNGGNECSLSTAIFKLQTKHAKRAATRNSNRFPINLTNLKRRERGPKGRRSIMNETFSTIFYFLVLGRRFIFTPSPFGQNSIFTPSCRVRIHFFTPRCWVEYSFFTPMLLRQKSSLTPFYWDYVKYQWFILDDFQTFWGSRARKKWENWKMDLSPLKRSESQRWKIGGSWWLIFQVS